MLELKFRKRDEYGQVMLTEDGIVNLLYSGDLDLSDVYAEDSIDIRLYNKWSNMFDDSKIQIYKKPEESVEEYDRKLQQQWLIPSEYKDINVEEFLLEKCSTDIERDRVKQEMLLFQEKEMEIILQILIYLVDIMRENKIVWGVGRGSACSSYCLFLIGIHKVDSLKYKLDIKEFLK